MKKILIFGVIIAIAAFFTLPSLIFADDVATSSVEIPSDSTDNDIAVSPSGGQYYVQDIVETGVESDPNDGELIEVICIDTDAFMSPGTTIYDEANEDADPLDAEGNDDGHVEYLYTEDFTTNNFDSSTITDGTPVNELSEEAVELLATNATGATPGQDQDAVWSFTNNVDEGSSGATKDIVDVVTAIVEGNHGGLVTIDVDAINDIIVAVDDNDKIFEDDGDGILEFDDVVEHTATATMAEPLVPGLTDQGKNTMWYLLSESYNVSFSKNVLVTVETSTMTDYEDNNDGENTTDNDNDGSFDDHYGKATIPYYFFWWGEGYDKYQMCANIGAWVDIDGDALLDVVDIDCDETNLQGENDTTIDGDVVGDIQKEFTIIDDTSLPVTSMSLPVTSMDIHKVDGGTVLNPITIVEGKEILDNEPGDGNNSVQQNTQRLVVKAYDEPNGSNMGCYSDEGKINIEKTDAITEGSLEGSTFQLWQCWGYDDSEVFNVRNTINLEHVVHGSTNGVEVLNGNGGCEGIPIGDPVPLGEGTNGMHTWSGLDWGQYWIEEVYAPRGYDVNHAYTEIGFNELEVTVIEDIADPRIDGRILVIKVDNGSTPLAGVGFTLYDSNGDPVGSEMFTDSNGEIKFEGLAWDTYTLKETTVPAGYYGDTDESIEIGPLTVTDESNDPVVIELTKTNTPIPPPPPPDTPKDPPTTTTTVAGIIEVAGITELPFTGMNPFIPISGISTLIGGAIALTMSLRRRCNKR